MARMSHILHPASQAIDGNPDSFWAGTYDVCMGCNCWRSEKIDQRATTLDMAAARPVGKIYIRQGHNMWCIKDIRICCGDSNGNFDTFAPLVLEISFEKTVIGSTAFHMVL